ncbi:MAG: hypothetical protein IVW57_14175 [Ktedonobacterales bacterium]|nr:hypothetical protein [Ktedonobacterales bacterium]
MPELRGLRPARLERIQTTIVADAPTRAGAMGGAASPPWRAVLMPALAVWAAVRAASLVLTLFAALLARGGLGPGTLLRQWNQWDAGWYISIAQHGYYSATSAAFFPLFPALTALVAVVVGGNYLLAAMIVSNLGSLGAFLGLGLLAAHEEGTLTASTRAILAMAAYPLAFYLVAPYSEGIFLAFAIFAIYFARRGQWRWAAVCGALAGLSRPTSLVLLPALLWEYGRQQGWWRREAWRQGAWRGTFALRALGRAALALGALPLAIASYMLFLAVRFGDPLLYTRAQSATWHHTSMPIWQTFGLIFTSLLHPPASTLFRFIMVVDFSALAAVAAITIFWARRVPFSFTLYTVGLLYLLLSAPIPDRPEVVTSSARYLLTAFPIFLVGGHWMKGRPRAAVTLLAVGFVLQAAFMVWFLTGHWAE